MPFTENETLVRTHASNRSKSDGADTILVGGTVHLLDASHTSAQALAISGGLIAATGTNEEIMACAGPETQIIELRGRTAIPGINDAHLHATWFGARWPELMFENPGPSWHTPTLATEDERVAAIKRAWEKLAALGITSYTEPGLGPGEDDGETGCFGTAVFETYRSLMGTPAQTARVTMLRLFGILDGLSTLDAFKRGIDMPVPATDPRWLAITGVKIFADGIPPMRSAWTIDPYNDGTHGDLMTGTGSTEQKLADFVEMIEIAHRRGFQIGVHATGDRTIEEMISAIESLGGSNGLGHYVIHGDLLHHSQIERMRRAGIGLTMQPLIADKTNEWFRKAVTAETAMLAWPMHEILQSGLVATLGSDGPVASPDWRKTIVSASRLLEARGVKVGRPEIAELLRMYTAIPAIQDHAQEWKGTLEAGKVADICVLARDPLQLDAREFPDLDIDMTMVDGRIVYSRPGPNLH